MTDPTADPVKIDGQRPGSVTRDAAADGLTLYCELRVPLRQHPARPLISFFTR